MHKPFVIAVDLGSNTLRITKLKCATGEFVTAYEKIVKTADGLERIGIINQKTLKRIIHAIREAKEQIDFSNAFVKAVTTEALRRASNREEVLASIEKETDVKFEIISGDREAQLTLLAVKHRLNRLQYASDSFVLVDIGGGSTELIFHYPDKMITKSFPIGIVTIAQQYSTLDAIQTALPQKMYAMQQFASEILSSQGRIESFIATAGTPTTVAAMKLGQTYATYDAEMINGTVLHKEELDVYLDKLLAMPFEARETMVGVGRSDLIAAGILIFKQIYDFVACDTCIVIDDGLREGVALEQCLRGQDVILYPGQ